MNTLDQLEHFYKYIYVYVISFSLFTYFLLISLGIMIRGTFIKQND